MINLTGSITAVVTPFNADESIDFESLERILNFQLEQGTKGIVVAGTTGEGYALEPEELFELVQFSNKIINKRVPLIAGTGTLVTKKTIQLSQLAQQAGADALLVINPYYNKPSDEFLMQHFTQVANSVDLPIILYNVPGRTGFNMSAQLVINLAQSCSNIVAIKEASGNVEQIVDIIQNAPAGFKVYSGDDSLAYTVISLGGHGCISVCANLIPSAFAQLCDLAYQGDLESAKELHHQYAELFSANFIDTNPVPVKTAMAKYGLCQNQFRAPFYSWQNQLKKEQYFNTLEKCGIELGQLVAEAV